MQTRRQARTQGMAEASAMPGLGQPTDSVREGETTLDRSRLPEGVITEQHPMHRSPERQPSTAAPATTERTTTPPSTNTTMAMEEASVPTNLVLPMAVRVGTLTPQRAGEERRTLPPSQTVERREAAAAASQTAMHRARHVDRRSQSMTPRVSPRPARGGEGERQPQPQPTPASFGLQEQRPQSETQVGPPPPPVDKTPQTHQQPREAVSREEARGREPPYTQAQYEEEAPPTPRSRETPRHAHEEEEYEEHTSSYQPREEPRFEARGEREYRDPSPRTVTRVDVPRGDPRDEVQPRAQVSRTHPQERRVEDQPLSREDRYPWSRSPTPVRRYQERDGPEAEEDRPRRYHHEGEARTSVNRTATDARSEVAMASRE